jgi:hypothetical protein
LCDSRLALIDRHSLRLGGQHGEEGKVQDGRQENGKEDWEEEEREAQVSDGRTRRSRRRPGQTLVATPTRRRAAGAEPLPSAAPAQSDERASAKTRSAFLGGDLLPNGSFLEHLADALIIHSYVTPHLAGRPREIPKKVTIRCAD